MALVYDFIYVDRDRVASLYAQIFGGHLLTIEELSETKKENSTNIAGKLPGIVEGSFSDIQKSLESIRNVIDPHEVRTIDVLSKLIEMKNNGTSSIVVEQGYLGIFDDFVIELWSALIDSFSEIKEMIEKTEGKEKLLAFEAFIKQSRKSLNLAPRPFPCIFLLKANQNSSIYGGTIKEKYLSEPASTFYIKHGNKWLKDIILIGLKEEAEAVTLTEKGMLTVLSESWPKLMHLMEFLLPPKTVSIVPLALMRRVGET